MSIRAVLEGIEARLDTISGLRTSAYRPDQVMPPHAVVGVPSVSDYIEAFGYRKYQLQPTITLMISASLDRKQLDLADYASVTGALSIPAAIRGDKTLGGAAENAEVTSFRPLNLEEVAAVGYYGGLFSLRVMVRENPI